MTLNELQRWMLSHEVEDSWWAAVDGEVLDSLMSLPDISKLKEQRPNSQISVLHESKSEDEEAQWTVFERDAPKKIKIVSDSRFGTMRIRSDKGDSAESEPDEPASKPETQPSGIAAEASSAPAFDSKLIDGLKNDIELLKRQIALLKKEVGALKNLGEDLKRPLMEAKQMLDEREQFLEESENSLFEKAQNQEVLQTELEQMREELDEREQQLSKRETALQGKA